MIPMQPSLPAALTLLFLPPTAHATLIAGDHFLGGYEPTLGEYSAGNIAGQNPTLPGWSVPWNTPGFGPDRLVFNPAGLTFGRLDCRGGHAQANPFTRVGRVLDTPYTDATATTLYLSFLLRVPNSRTSHYKAFELHEGGLDNPPMDYDELRLGTTWAAVIPLDPRLAFDFDGGTTEGWPQLTAPASPQKWTVAQGDDAHSGTWSVKQDIPAGSDGGSPHATMWLRSPEFKLNASGDLSFFLMGGGFNTSAFVPFDDSEVPADSIDTDDPEGGGFHSVVLRDAVTGEFVRSFNRPTDGTDWQLAKFSAQEIKFVLEQYPDATFTLDLIDARHGTWGWCNLDTVRIPGTLAGESAFVR